MTAALKILASGQVLTQVATITGSPTGGTWTPYVRGVSAGTVAYNASAATLQTALRTVDSSISVSGSSGGPYTITVPGGAGDSVIIGNNSLTGGTSPNVAMSGSESTVYTVPALTSAKIASAVICNTGVLAAKINVSIVPSGQSVDATRRVVASYPLDAYESAHLPALEGTMLGAGTFISISSDVAGVVNYLLTGAEIS